MTVLAKKSILARLLARENITVEHTNHHTAFFDVERRILGLPQWKDIGKDLYDLFVGHEIGHALHTPAEGWHESTTQIPGCPRSYVNIVEDIRIEKLVLREFPGLLGAFLRGYQDLLDRDFFGIKDEDVNKLSFMNRLNIFAKARGLVKVRFSSKEQPYVDRAMAVETWDDVMDSCRELYAFMKAELEAERKAQEDLVNALKEAGIKLPQAIPDKIVIKAGENGEGKAEPMSKELKDAIKNGEVEIEIDVESFKDAIEEGSSEESEGDIGVSLPELDKPKEESEEDEDIITVGDSNVDGVETDAIFRAAIANALVDSLATGGNTLYAKGPTKAQADAVTRSYEEVKHGRWKKVNSADFPEKKYIRFLSDTKDSVTVMVKEFEMRKTARRFARARTSTKGSLDVNSLHKYKYEDNIFKQVTHLDDDQSHGMMMLIDYSSSMSTVLPKVIKQLLILVTFCKRVNIPFEVYGFTSPTLSNSKLRAASQTLTSVSMSNCHIFKLIDSSMSKKTYEEAFKGLFAQIGSHRRSWMGSMESMSGTPLDASILAMYHHIAAFRAKHNVQKMNFITLTDGESEAVGFQTGIDVNSAARPSKRIIEVNGTKISMDHGYGRGTSSILQGLREQGVRTMNYHLITPSELKYRVDANTAEAAIAAMKKDGCFVVDDKNGYDRQILTSLISEGTSSSSNDDDDDELEGDVKGLAEAFQNKALKKKRNRLVAAKFAEVVS